LVLVWFGFWFVLVFVLVWCWFWCWFGFGFGFGFSFGVGFGVGVGLILVLFSSDPQTVNGMSFSQCNRINFYTLDKLSSSHLPYLRSLDLSHWLQMSSIEWRGILNLPRLTRLIVNDQDYAIHLTNLFSMTNLEHLEAGSNVFHAAQDFALLTRMKKLNVLSLGTLDSLTFSFIILYYSMLYYIMLCFHSFVQYS
jgi:hypothetical protein